MKKNFLYTIFFLVVLSLHFLFFSQSQNNGGMLVDFLYILAPVSAFFAGILLIKKLGLKNPLGLSLSFLVLGMLSFNVGEISWFFLEHIFKIDPYPSIADFFFLVVYPISLMGIIIKVKTEKIKLSLSLFKKFLPFVFGLLILTIVVVYFGIYGAYVPEEGLASNLVSMLYGVGDLILIFGCFLVLIITIEHKGGKMFSPWMMVALSYFILLVADVIFSANRDTYEMGGILKMITDWIWMVGYFIFGLGMLNFLEIIQFQQEKIKSKLNLK